MSGNGYRKLSLWHATVGDELTPRPSFATAQQGDRAVDVAIVGAGYTGLWTAYYLKLTDPSLRVVICEAEVAGFGASGRNGGWCSALYPVSLTTLASEQGDEAAIRQQRAMQQTVAEVGRIVAAENLDADWGLGGTVTVARSSAQLERAHEEITEARRFGFGEHDLALLDASQARARLNATGVIGGVYTPHCAAIHPAKLVRSLADRVETLGVRIYEGTRVRAIDPGRLATEHGDLRAEVIVRATEGFTPGWPVTSARSSRCIR
jgi:glycine/D-amino acid oxidase-like deaminating enzyme